MESKWYALQSKARKEEALWRQVELEGHACYYPRFRVHPVNPRARKHLPYFPGYLFVRIDITAIGLSTFRWMPFALGIVCFGGEPAPVPDSLIGTLRRHLDRMEQPASAAGPVYNRGERVVILEGPLAGYEALFQAHLDGRDRVKVLIEFLAGRGVPVELGASLIERTSPRS